MKFLFTSLFFFFFSSLLAQQQFGAPVNDGDAVEASQIDIDGDLETITKVKGTVQEVCKVKGCWMTMDLGNDRSMRITFRDYGFFVPTNSSGRTAILEGELKTEIIDVPTLKHFAKDAGQAPEEIEAIDQPVTELVFVADGVLLLD
jgi:hypothetical protein